MVGLAEAMREFDEFTGTAKKLGGVDGEETNILAMGPWIRA
jgi:hypothetical protein